MSQQIGYIRVSTVLQNEDRQLADVRLDIEFVDKVSGKDTNRPKLNRMLEHIREGDTVHVHDLSRLGRSVTDLTNLIKEIVAKGVNVKFHKEGLTFTAENNPTSNLMLNLLGAVYQFERDIMLERQREGIEIAKQKGKYKGRKPSVNRENIKAKLDAGVSIRNTAKELGIAASTVQRVKKELEEQN